MSPKWNYILGAVTITVIVGGTIYAIKKSKDVAKAEEEAITVEEAMEIVADRRREREEEDEVRFEKPIEVVVEPSIKVAVIKGKEELDDFDPMNIESHLYDLEEDEEDEEDEDPLNNKYEPFTMAPEPPTIEPLKDFMYVEEGIDPKGDNILRHPKDSDAAKHQFIRMELAEWHHDWNVYRIMLQLFELPFVPMTDGDEFLRTKIIEYRVEFFGLGSKWNREVSYADLICHYARRAAYDCGEFYSYWVEYFLSFIELEWDSTSQEMDTIILRLNSHSYFNDERQTFGLFGLTREDMDQAIRVANGNVDRSVTYDIEFNEFLKSRI